MDTYYIPVARITSGSVVTYSLPTTRPTRTEKQEETKANLTRGKFNGVISDKARRRLKRTAEQWLLSIQEAKKEGKAHKGKLTRYVTFVTLTLSAKQQHSDQEIKREMLNTFLIYSQRHLNVKEFIWRAEAQANGNIHFHLFLDSYIPHAKLRAVWNKCQEKLGYIERFKAIYGHGNPNSTDIERIRSAKGATLYVTKYIAKESKYRKLNGRVWGCSDGLKKVLAFETIGDSETFALIQELEADQTKRVIHADNYSVYLGDIKTLIESKYPGLAKEIKAHKIQTYKSTYP